MENVVHIKNAVLAALAALGTFVANALGGWDAALQVLIGLMAADYVTGLIVARGVQALRQKRDRGIGEPGGLQGHRAQMYDFDAGVGSHHAGLPDRGRLHPHCRLPVLHRQRGAVHPGEYRADGGTVPGLYQKRPGSHAGQGRRGENAGIEYWGRCAGTARRPLQVQDQVKRNPRAKW